MSKRNGEYKISEAQLRRMRDARMGYAAIAKVFGCDPQTVRFWLKRFGMPTKLDPVEYTDEYVDAAIASHLRQSRIPRDAFKVNYKH